MGFFSANYSKEGPGVDKNGPKKKGIFLYFEIFGRKLLRLCQANLLYMTASIPLIVILYMFFSVFVGHSIAEYLAQGISMAAQDIDSSTVQGMMQLWITFMGIVTVMSLWGSGPASAGLAYIMRCFTREENAFIWGDFKEQFKLNFKKSIGVALIDLVMVFMAANAVYFYMSMYRESGQFAWLVVVYAAVLALMIYSFAHIHIYQIMITFDCGFGEMYKNALMLAMAKLPMNFLLSVIMLAFNIIIYSLLPNPLLGFIVTYIGGYMFTRFPMEFYSSRVIDGQIKNMPKKAKISYIEEDE